MPTHIALAAPPKHTSPALTKGWTPDQFEHLTNGWTPEQFEHLTNGWTPDQFEHLTNRWTPDQFEHLTNGWTPDQFEHLTNGWTPDQFDQFEHLTNLIIWTNGWTVIQMCCSDHTATEPVTQVPTGIGERTTQDKTMFLQIKVLWTITHNLCTVQAFLTTQLESGNWRKRTTTWRLNLQPTP